MKLTIAVQGCCHGELDNIYGTLQLLEKKEGRKVDLVLICGDFEAVRNADDLETMACPPKFRDLKDFHKYYSGAARAPIPTIFIGGNHEASAYLMELYYGGWAAPNIYFLGFAGCVRFGGLRIAGLSGIYKSHDYCRGRHEQLPYTDSTMRSIYHIRDFEAFRLRQLLGDVDVFMSHDWPVNVTRYGDASALFREKPYFRKEAESGVLGSPPAQELLKALQPRFWFSAHLHCKFAAMIPHSGGAATRFLALDKCLPGRDFLQVFEVDVPDNAYAADEHGAPVFEYDEEWLAVLRSTWSATNLRAQHVPLPIAAVAPPKSVSLKDDTAMAAATSGKEKADKDKFDGDEGKSAVPLKRGRLLNLAKPQNITNADINPSSFSSHPEMPGDNVTESVAETDKREEHRAETDEKVASEATDRSDKEGAAVPHTGSADSDGVDSKAILKAGEEERAVTKAGEATSQTQTSASDTSGSSFTSPRLPIVFNGSNVDQGLEDSGRQLCEGNFNNLSLPGAIVRRNRDTLSGEGDITDEISCPNHGEQGDDTAASRHKPDDVATSVHYVDGQSSVPNASRKTCALQPLRQRPAGRGRFGARQEDLEFVRDVFRRRGTRQIPENFQPTAPAHSSTGPNGSGSESADFMFSADTLGQYHLQGGYTNNRNGQQRGGRFGGGRGGRHGGRGGAKPVGRMPTVAIRNPQTVAFVEMLGLSYNLEPVTPSSQSSSWTSMTYRNNTRLGRPFQEAPPNATRAFYNDVCPMEIPSEDTATAAATGPSTATATSNFLTATSSTEKSCETIHAEPTSVPAPVPIRNDEEIDLDLDEEDE